LSPLPATVTFAKYTIGVFGFYYHMRYVEACFRDELDNVVEEEDGGWICFLGGNYSSGTKKRRGSNSNDGGNTGDGVKIVGGVIGSCGGIAMIPRRQMLPEKLSSSVLIFLVVIILQPLEDKRFAIHETIKESDDDDESAENNEEKEDNLQPTPLPPKFVPMATLCFVGGHVVSGVAENHYEIVKQDVFNDFYKAQTEEYDEDDPINIIDKDDEEGLPTHNINMLGPLETSAHLREKRQQTMAGAVTGLKSAITDTMQNLLICVGTDQLALCMISKRALDGYGMEVSEIEAKKGAKQLRFKNLMGMGKWRIVVLFLLHVRSSTVMNKRALDGYGMEVSEIEAKKGAKQLRFKNLMGMGKWRIVVLFLLHVRSSIVMNKSVVKLLMVMYMWKLSSRGALFLGYYFSITTFTAKEIIENLALYDHEGWTDMKEFVKPVKAISTPQGTTFEARIRDYMAAHTERIENFENFIFKQHEEINDIMTEMFGLIKELTTSKTLEKVLIREESKFPVTKNLNSISLARGEEERSDKTEGTLGNAVKSTVTATEIPVKEAERNNETKNKLIKRLRIRKWRKY
nr:alpha-1,4 glucan phosphorylase L isozyme, chloroplastic/amyloplastic [Tanacetum cinerariifolium]